MPRLDQASTATTSVPPPPRTAELVSTSFAGRLAPPPLLVPSTAAQAPGLHPADLFLDLVVEHGKKLRWRSTIANHRPRAVEEMIVDPNLLLAATSLGGEKQVRCAGRAREPGSETFRPPGSP